MWFFSIILIHNIILVATGRGTPQVDTIKIIDLQNEIESLPDHVDEEEDNFQNIARLPRTKIEPKYSLRQDGIVLGLQYSNNGKYLAVALRKYVNPDLCFNRPLRFEPDVYFDIEESVELRIFETTTYTLVKTLTGGIGKTTGEATFLVSPGFSSCDNYIACGSEDGVVRVWDVESGILVSKIESHTAPVNFCAWHPTEPIIVSGGDDYKLVIHSNTNTQLII